MNKYTLGAIGIVALLIIGSFLLPTESKENTSEARIASPIVVVEQPHDFGDIDIFGGKVSTTYTLKNEGTEDVTITRAQTSCMCTEGQIEDLQFGMHGSTNKKVVIPAGEAKTLTAIYDPLAHGPNGVGPVTRELMLQTNSEVTPEIQVKFSGNVIKNEQS